MSSSRDCNQRLSQSRPSAGELPALQKKPSYDTLLNTLNDLAIAPTSWNGPSKNDVTVDAKAVSQYLLSIISSDLAWLNKTEDNRDEALDDDQKDELWELASRRLAERCGRSAMPEMIRTWTVPASTTLPEMKFEIREPPFAGDNLGLKTWGTAFAIAKKLDALGGQYLDHLLTPTDKIANHTMKRTGLRVLELGSGTGLVGIAAGAIWGTTIVLTDLPEIKDNLLFNIERNSATVESMGGALTGDVLDWKDSNSLRGYTSTEFEIIIAADPLYDDNHPRLVAENIKRYLKAHPDSRALTAVPMRDNHTKSMATKFRQLMQKHSFELVHDGEEICHDDWAEDEDEEKAVKCWWGIWKPTVYGS